MVHEGAVRKERNWKVLVESCRENWNSGTWLKNKQPLCEEDLYSSLIDANTPENFVAQLSVHKNVESLQSYKSASEQHQRGMSRVLSRQSSSLRMESSQVFARSTSLPLCSPPAKQQEESLLQVSEATKTAQTKQPVLRKNTLMSHSTTAASTSSQAGICRCKYSRDFRMQFSVFSKPCHFHPGEQPKEASSGH